MSLDKDVINEFEDRFTPMAFRANLLASGLNKNYVDRISEIYETGVYKNVMDEIQEYEVRNYDGK